MAVLDGVLLNDATAPLGAFTTLQTPVPTVATLAFNVNVLAQVLVFIPALETVGASSLVMLTSLTLGVQLPLEIVQRNTLVPTPKPVI